MPQCEQAMARIDFFHQEPFQTREASAQRSLHRRTRMGIPFAPKKNGRSTSGKFYTRGDGKEPVGITSQQSRRGRLQTICSVDSAMFFQLSSPTAASPVARCDRQIRSAPDSTVSAAFVSRHWELFLYTYMHPFAGGLASAADAVGGRSVQTPQLHPPMQ
jgi:hypothetical protein